MNKCTCLLFETGFPEGTPGCTTNLSSSSFPFWGNFFFADILVSNFVQLAENQKLHFFADETAYSEVQNTIRRWKLRNNVELLLCPQTGMEFASRLKQLKSELFLIGGTSHTFIFAEEQLQEVLKKQNTDIARLSVEMTPLDLFAVTRKKLMSIISKLNPQEDSLLSFKQMLFKKLASDFDTIEDIPGRIFFHKHAIDLFSSHMFLLESSQCEEYARIAERFSFLSGPHKESYISETGQVKNAFISAGAEIHGSVINSVIFPGVSIAAGAIVENSVIMSNNRIGPNTKIENSLIFPYMKSTAHETYNIGTEAHIGSLSKAANSKYPEHIYDGISLLGLNPEIPSGTVIDAACYIAPNLSIGVLPRYNNRVKKGMCIEK